MFTYRQMWCHGRILRPNFLVPRQLQFSQLWLLIALPQSSSVNCLQNPTDKCLHSIAQLFRAGLTFCWVHLRYVIYINHHSRVAYVKKQSSIVHSSYPKSEMYMRWWMSTFTFMTYSRKLNARIVRNLKRVKFKETHGHWFSHYLFVYHRIINF